MGILLAQKDKDGIRELHADTFLTLERKIWLNGAIEQETAYEVINKLLALDQESHEEITMYICSPGGAISDGLAIYDVMNAIESPVRTVAVGLVASMASIILSSGTKGRRETLPSAKILIHDPRIMGGSGVMTTSQVIELGNDLQNTKKLTNSILAKNCGKKLKEVNEDTLDERYMSAKEAIEYGIVDRLVERM